MVGHVFDRSRLKVIDVPSNDEQSVQADHCLGKKQQLINRTAFYLRVLVCLVYVNSQKLVKSKYVCNNKYVYYGYDFKL